MKNIPKPAIPILLASLSDSTMRQYNSTYKLWWKYCKQNNVSFYDFTVSDVISFLTSAFQKGASYGSLNSHRSALALISRNNNLDDIRLKRFFKGIFRIRPPKPKYKTTWDPEVVINYCSTFYPNDSLTLIVLSMKVATLLALITAQRIQTLSKINIEQIQVTDTLIKIKIPDLIKTSGPKNFQPCLTIPFFRHKPEVCVASCLLSYVNLTKNLRSADNNYLFISTKKPYARATVQTISRWIKTTLLKSGIDKSFTSHSTRHASTSAANRKGINIEQIRKTAGWTDNSNVFARFYNRPLVNETEFAGSMFSDI